MNGLGKNKSKEQGKREARGDDFTVEIKFVQPNKKSKDKAIEKTVMTGSGSWLSHLIINNEVLWRIEDPYPTWKEPGEAWKMNDGTTVLPSDSKCRPDLEYIKN